MRHTDKKCIDCGNTCDLWSSRGFRSRCKLCYNKHRREVTAKLQEEREGTEPPEENKTCIKCGANYVKKTFRSGNQCASCISEANKEWALNNPDKRKESADKIVARRIELHKLVMEYKREHPCACGESRIPTLQFDHIDPADKTENVSIMVRKGKPKEVVFAEIAKCEVKCVNCHAVRSAEQLGHYKDLDITLPD